MFCFTNCTMDFDLISFETVHKKSFNTKLWAKSELNLNSWPVRIYFWAFSIYPSHPCCGRLSFGLKFTLWLDHFWCTSVQKQSFSEWLSLNLHHRKQLTDLFSCKFSYRQVQTVFCKHGCLQNPSNNSLKYLGYFTQKSGAGNESKVWKFEDVWKSSLHVEQWRGKASDPHTVRLNVY